MRVLLLSVVSVAAFAAVAAALRLPMGVSLAAGSPSPPPEALGEGADPAALERSVRFLAETVGPRGQRHPEAMHRAADHVAAEFRAHGGRLELQPTGVGSPPFANVVGRFGPSSGDVRVVGSHYDSFRDTAGADDNASGVAALLELARLLARSAPPSPTVLVAYANEEPPHFRTSEMGSVTHARSVSAETRIVVLEMIGFFADEPGSQDAPFASLEGRIPSRGNFVVVVGRSEDERFAEAVRDALSLDRPDPMPVFAFTAPATRLGIDFSDHRSYWARDLPAVMVTDTAFLRNHAYHSEEDTPERLDYERMAAVVDGVFAWLVSP